MSGLESATAITHDQLAERDGRMRPADADMRLAHNLGGPGSVSAAAVFSRP